MKPSACLYIDQNNIFFRYRKLDFSKLLKMLNLEFEVMRATSYMSLDRDSDSQKKFITYLSNNGYKCETIDLSEDTNIDHILIPDMIYGATNLKPDYVILMSGDAHFAHALNQLSGRGFRTMVIGARDYVAYELLKVCDSIKYIEDFKGVILDN
jgi:uncharacterized LabA/DUF88 family protein